MNKNQNKLTISLSIIVSVLVIGVAIFYTMSKSGSSGGGLGIKTPTLGEQGLSLSGLSLKGNPNASSTIVEFGDFQCIACAQFFAMVEPQLKTEFIDTGKANMAFKPLTFIDQFAGKERQGESWHAAQAVECAADQGKFWEMYDAIYSAEASEAAAGKNNENSGNLTRDFFTNVVKGLNIDVNQFASCYDSQAHTDKIDGFYSDAQKAMGSQISTPTVFVIKDGTVQKIASPFDINSYKAIISK
jgi:protein-disulfide isomerase